MEQWMVALIDSDVALKVNSLLGFVWLGLFFVYYFSREGRDERGRKGFSLCTTFPGRGGTSAGAR